METPTTNNETAHVCGGVPCVIVRNMPDADYRAANRASKHLLDVFMKNPYAFASKVRAGEPLFDEPSAEMITGSAAHCLLLTPEAFAADFAVLPETITTRRGKAWDAFRDENAGKQILKAEEVNTATFVAKAVQDIHALYAVLQDTPRDAREVSLFCELEGVPFKARIDWLHGLSIYDLKTASDASPEAFARACDEYGYDIQAAAYFEACYACRIEATSFRFVVVEKKFPYSVAIYDAHRDSDFVRAGRLELHKRLALYKRYLDEGVDAFAESGVPVWTSAEIALPAWSKRLRALRDSEEAPFGE